MKRKSPPSTVFGQEAPPPRITGTGWRLILLYGVGPLLMLLLALDVIGYVIVRFVFGSCYGLLCLL